MADSAGAEDMENPLGFGGEVRLVEVAGRRMRNTGAGHSDFTYFTLDET